MATHERTEKESHTVEEATEVPASSAEASLKPLADALEKAVQAIQHSRRLYESGAYLPVCSPSTIRETSAYPVRRLPSADETVWSRPPQLKATQRHSVVGSKRVRTGYSG